MKNIKSRVSTLLTGGSRYFFIGVAFFLCSAALSYKVFRKNEFDIEVKLADVSFVAELPHVVEGDGTITAAEAWDLSVDRPGKLDKLLVKDGQSVKKGQPIAYIDSVLHQSQLKEAIATYTTLIKKSKPRVNDDETDDTAAPARPGRHASIAEARRRLQDAKQHLLDSILKAPGDGIVKVLAAAEGSVLPAGSTLAKVENRSELKITARLALPLNTNLADSFKITLTSLTPPLDLDAKLRRSRVAGGDAPTTDSFEVLIAPTDQLLSQLDKPVHLKVVLGKFNNVALVERSAVVSQDGQSKLLLLNSFGFMRWLNVSKAPFIDGHVVIEGVDPNLFHVVKPDHLEAVNIAIAESARPKVLGPRKL